MKAPVQSQRVTIWLCLALAAATIALYLPALHHDFLLYDDQQYVTENPHVRSGLSWHGVVWASGYHASNWHPLAWLSHMLDCEIYGLKAGGHHLTNVLLHAASAVVLFLLLNRTTGARWRSFFVAGLFAWHPLHVESVAWVAERKDVLSAFFGLSALLAYTSYTTHKTYGTYAISLVLFALALMSKPMVVTLPFVMLLLDFWPLNRVSGVRCPPSVPIGSGLRRTGQVSGSEPAAPPHDSRFAFHVSRLILEKVPFFAAAAITCVLTVSAQQQAIVSTAGLPVVQRISHALVAYVHYVSAMFVPVHLSVYYPYKVEIPGHTIALAGVLLALTTMLACQLARRWPYLATGWLWFLGMLVPVIGLVQVGDQAWADRYTYLPLIGLFIAIVWGAVDLFRSTVALRVTAVVVAVALIVLTSVQLSHWKNTRTLFEHASKVTPENYMAITMLGSLQAKDGKLDEAIENYRTALRYKPGFPEAHFFFGNALDQQGKLEEAIAEYEKALWFRPTQEQTHIFLGVALAKQKKYEAATAHYLAALKLDSRSSLAHNNYARLLHTQGQLDQAIEHYSLALNADPEFAQAHNNLGIALTQKGKLAEGAAELREALRLNPGNAESEYNLALVLNQQGKWSEAAELFSKTVSTSSTDPNAHYQFAMALAHEQKTREALSHYASALLLQPDFPDALNGLSWILSTHANPDFRNGAEAVQMARRACELTGQQDPEKLKTLAAAYAETGKFEEAIASAQSARDLASGAGRHELAKQCQLMLDTFKAGKPWRS